ncbi:trypsin-like [Oratosquilla oratoria]|uniref:trypsin-like n=1 Tax=Oratosquilla oratoria TaxID=337810 RepID=UPI003F769736
MLRISVSRILFALLLQNLIIDAQFTEDRGLPEGAACSQKDSIPGVCTEITACLKDGAVVRRNDKILKCDIREDRVLVCCRKTTEIAQQWCNTWEGLWKKRDGGCQVITHLIVGGVEAGVGEFPHIAHVGTRSNDFIKMHCGGSLIHRKWVITAGHCVEFTNVEYVVQLGEHDVRYNSDTPIRVLDGNQGARAPTEQLVTVKRIFLHELFVERYHDIVLLKLNKPVQFTSRVIPACLFNKKNEDLIGSNVVVAGWGNTREGVGSNQLMKASLSVQDRLMCSQDLQDSYSQLDQGVTQNLVCAGAQNKDSCQGDSGGPLMIGERCHQVLFGLVAFGDDCKDLGAYTRISSYIDWIVETIVSNDN